MNPSKVWRVRVSVVAVVIWVVLVPTTALAAGGFYLAQAAPQGLDLGPVLDLVCGLLRVPLLCPEPEQEPEQGQISEPAAAPAAPAPGAAQGLEFASDAVPPIADPPPIPPAAAIQEQPASTEQAQTAMEQSEAPMSTVEMPRVPMTPTAAVGSSGREPAREPLGLAYPDEVDLSLRTVAAAAGVSLLGLILIGFPAELFNKTMRENYSSLKRMFPWIGKAPTRRQVGWQIGALIVSSAAAGLIGSFQKVRDWNLNDVLLVAVSLAVGFLVTNACYEIVSAVAGRELGMPPRIFKSYPGALPFVALFVAISAVGGLQPAYVYGHIAGSRIEDPVSVPLRSRALQTVSAAVSLLLLTIVCWALRAVVGAPFFNALLAGITIVGLNRLVFALVPATFLDGLAPFQYSRALWASIYVPTVTAFLLLVLLPATKRSGGGPIVASIVLFLLFAGVSLGLWMFFKRSRQGSLVQA